MKNWKQALYLIPLLFLLSCNKGPVPIKYGHDICNRCSMVIMDSRFGAEAVTGKGKILKFDSAECMVKFAESKKADPRGETKLYVTDAANPGILIPAENAFFLISENFPSPMGAFLSAYASKSDLNRYIAEYSGKTCRWNELPAVISN